MSCLQLSVPGPPVSQHCAVRGQAVDSPHPPPARAVWRPAERSGEPGIGGGEGRTEGETRATRWTLRPPRCGDVQPSLAGAAVSGASGGIGSRHSDTRNPMESGPGNTFSAQIEKNQKIHGFDPKKGGVILSKFLTPPPSPPPSLKTSKKWVSSGGGGLGGSLIGGCVYWAK